MENNNTTTTADGSTAGAPAPGAEQKPDQTPDDTGKKESDGSSVDYKALLEEERKAKEEALSKLGKAEYTLYKKNKEDNENKKNQKSNSGSDDEEEDDAEEEEDEQVDVVDVVEQKLQEFKQNFTRSFVNKEIKTTTSSEEEAELVKFYYDNKIVKSGYDEDSIKKDIELAHVLANRKKIQKSIAEISKKTESDSAKSYGGASGQDIPGDAPAKKLELTDEDKRVMARYGLKPEDIKN